MVEIITTDGVSLDLALDSEFELTYDHPALEDDRIPSPYSTSIAFPATERNKAVFGYVPAMMLPPSVTDVPATIFVSGIPLMKGHLVYEGMEDGLLNYDFSTDELAGSWSRKLFATGVTDASFPPVVNKEGTTKTIYGYPPSEVEVKYQNWPDISRPVRLLPAVGVAALLAEIAELDISPAGLPSGLAILGLYRETGASPAVPGCLPDRTLLDLLTGIAKIFCCAVYKDGEGYCLRKITDIFQNPDVIDWDDKVSDACSYSKEEARGFRLAFADESSEDTYNDSDIADDIRSGSIHTENNLRSMLDSEQVGYGGYTAVKVSSPGDVFSIKKLSCTVSEGGTTHSFDDYLLDVIKHNASPVDFGENPFDCSTDFHLVRCIPVIHRVNHRPWSTTNPDWQSDVLMAPVLAAPVEGADRDDKVYIGVLRNGQLVDHGVYGSGQDFLQDASASLIAGSIYGSRSLFMFASWLQKDRQVITVPVDLSVSEIVEFRQWKVVSIRNRRFLVKQLRVRLSAASSAPETEADLIAL